MFPEAILQVSTDVTARQQGERELLAVNRALTTLSPSSHALVHATNEEHLLSAICDTVVNKCGYRFAWVGFLDPQTSALRAVKWAGEGLDYLQEVSFGCADDTEHSPVCLAMRTRRPALANDIAAAPRDPRRDAALRRGFASMLAVPLTEGERPVSAVLVLYSHQVAAFTDTAVTLLRELADELSYGLEALRSAAAQ